MDNKIKITDLNMVYTGLEDDDGSGLGVLSDVNLEVFDNEFVSLLGPSGCGKSTLLRLIAGLEQDYEGEILCAGIIPGTRGSRFVTCFKRIVLCPGGLCCQMFCCP